VPQSPKGRASLRSGRPPVPPQFPGLSWELHLQTVHCAQGCVEWETDVVFSNISLSLYCRRVVRKERGMPKM